MSRLISNWINNAKFLLWICTGRGNFPCALHGSLTASLIVLFLSHSPCSFEHLLQTQINAYVELKLLSKFNDIIKFVQSVDSLMSSNPRNDEAGDAAADSATRSSAELLSGINISEMESVVQRSIVKVQPHIWCLCVFSSMLGASIRNFMAVVDL